MKHLGKYVLGLLLFAVLWGFSAGEVEAAGTPVATLEELQEAIAGGAQKIELTQTIEIEQTTEIYSDHPLWITTADGVDSMFKATGAGVGFVLRGGSSDAPITLDGENKQRQEALVSGEYDWKDGKGSLSLEFVCLTGGNNISNSNSGGAIWANVCDLTLESVKFLNNQAKGDGGAVSGSAFVEPVSIRVFNCEIRGNRAGKAGGGFNLNQGGNTSIVIQDSVFTENRSDASGGWTGGAIYLGNTPKNVLLENIEVYGNEAQGGNGICTEFGANVQIAGERNRILDEIGILRGLNDPQRVLILDDSFRNETPLQVKLQNRSGENVRDIPLVEFGAGIPESSRTVIVVDQNGEKYILDNSGKIRKPIQDAVVTAEGSEELSYSGNGMAPTYTVLLNGNFLTEGTDFKVSYIGEDGMEYADGALPVNPGKYRVIIQGIGVYGGTLEASFSIVHDHALIQAPLKQYLIRNATCTEAALYVESCEICGEKGEKTFFAGDPLGHRAVFVEEKKPTASETGNLEYWYCSVCGSCFRDAKLTEEVKRETLILPKSKGEEIGTDGDSNPSTGDTGAVIVYGVLFCLTGVGLFLTAIYVKKSKKKR